MERLTTRNSMGVAVFKEPYGCENCNESLWRLPDYGNGSPTERLAQYEEAEEQGLLFRLPCRVGDTVYHTVIPPDKSEVIPFKISGIKVFISEDGNFKFDLYGDTFPSLKGDIIGERVFFTKEEAEQALLKMKGE